MAKVKAETNHWLILVILALAQFMVVLDISIVNVMLPTVQHAFHLSESSLQWVITAYTITFGGFLLFGGRAADLFGRKKIFLAGVAVFTLVSMLDGLAQSGTMLIVLRGIQGLTAAFMSPAALSIVLVNYKEGHGRNVALSVWGAVASGGAAIGVLLGGVLTQYLGWRWNFFINVPIGILVFLIASRIVPKHEAEESKPSLDTFGALSVTAALMLVVYAITNAPTVGWATASTLGYLSGALILLVFFVINEKRVSHPLVPLHIFKVKNIAAANVIQLCLAAGLYATFFFTTLLLQDILGYSPVKTGLAFIVVPLSITAMAVNAPRVIKKIGYKWVLMVAPLLTATGLFYLSRIPINGGYFDHIMPGLILMGLGLGFTFVSVLVAATSGVAGHLSGLASGLINTTQQLGGSLGLAILAGIASSVTLRYLSVIPRPTHLDIIKANVHAFHVGFVIAGFFSIFASLLALVVIRQVKSKSSSKPSLGTSI